MESMLEMCLSTTEKMKTFEISTGTRMNIAFNPMQRKAFAIFLSLLFIFTNLKRLGRQLVLFCTPCKNIVSIMVLLRKLSTWLVSFRRLTDATT